MNKNNNNFETKTFTLSSDPGLERCADEIADLFRQFYSSTSISSKTELRKLLIGILSNNLSSASTMNYLYEEKNLGKETVRSGKTI